MSIPQISLAKRNYVEIDQSPVSKKSDKIPHPEAWTNCRAQNLNLRQHLIRMNTLMAPQKTFIYNPLLNSCLNLKVLVIWKKRKKLKTIEFY
jgi:hypothetical protein